MKKLQRNAKDEDAGKKEKSVLLSLARNEKLYILLIAFVALLFRLVYFYQLKTNSPIYSLLIHDSALYNELAHRVIEKGLVGDNAFYISPLYIYFLAFIYKVFGDGFNAVRLVQFILGIGTALLTFGIGARLFNKKVGLVAGLVAAVYAPFLFFEGNLLATSLVTFFLCAFVYFLLVIQKKPLGLLVSFVSGLSLALAITGRPNLILLAPLPFIFLYLKSKEGAFSFPLYSLPLLIGLFIPIGLTSAHNYLAGKTLMPLTTHGGINFYIGNHQGASGAWEAPKGISASVSAINLEESKKFAEKETGRALSASEVSKFWYNRAFSDMIQHPFAWLGLAVKKLLLFWSAYETPLNYDYYFHQRYSSLLKFPLLNLGFVMPFAILGLLLLLRESRSHWFLYAFIVLASASVILFFMADRYRIPIMPMLLIVAAVGILKLVQIIRAPGYPKIIWLSLLVILLGTQWGYTSHRIKGTNFANDCYNISLAHLIENDFKSAVFWGQQAISEDPTYEIAHYNLGIAYLKLKDYDRAFVAFSEAVKLDSTDAGAQRNLGALLLIRQEYRKALPHLQTSVKYEADNIGGLTNLGLGYFYLQEYEKAIETWQQILTIDPGNEQIKRNINAATAALRRWSDD